MKIKIALYISILAVILFLPSCTDTANIDAATTADTADTISVHTDITSSSGESNGQVEFILNASTSDLPETVKTYKIVSPNVTVESVTAFGANLGFTGQASISNDDIRMSKSGGQEILQVNMKSGTIEYTCPNKLFPRDPVLPSNEEALQIATDFLKQAGLLFPDMEAIEVVVGGTSGGKPAHLLVRFIANINNIPLTGPGNKLGVRIGNGGEVIRFLIHYPEVTEYNSVKCIEHTKAFEQLKSSSNTRENSNMLPDDCHQVIIDKIYIGYFLKNINEEQFYLMPVYTFKGRCLDINGNYIEDFTEWIEAAEKQ